MFVTSEITKYLPKRLQAFKRYIEKYEWELYGRIGYSCPGRARPCVLNTHNNPYQRSVKVPYI